MDLCLSITHNSPLKLHYFCPSKQVCLMLQSWDNVASMHDSTLIEREYVYVCKEYLLAY